VVGGAPGAYQGPGKKLISVARHLALGHEGDIAVYRCNLQAVEVWLMVGSWWRRAGSTGVAVGLDWSAVIAALRDVFCIAEAERKVLVRQLQVMERATLEVFKQSRG